jgi:ribosomal protein L12E/L44/L45/RPP1/RPP2
MVSNLSQSAKEDLATSLAVLALYDGGAEISSSQISTLLEATNNEVEAFLPIIFANYLSNPEQVAKLISSPGGVGGGGGGGGGGAAADAGADAAEEAKEEKKEEEEEMDLGGGMDMFGGDEGGGGDY